MWYVAVWQEQCVVVLECLFFNDFKCFETIQHLKQEVGRSCLPHSGDEDKQVERLNDLPCKKEMNV